jgi:dienelactone hydrolase
MQRNDHRLQDKPVQRTDHVFWSTDAQCAAWLYRPQPSGAGPVPCVVLASGFSGTRDQRLDAFAERFAAAGLAALVFDYRHFGDSGGEPRQLLDIGRQLADWQAAIGYARTLDGIDPARIALWGSSFSGGHVMTLAARDPAIAAVVSQVAFADGLKTLPQLGGLGQALWLTREGLRDQLGALRGKPPRMVAAVGPPGSKAVMNKPDAEAGNRAITPPGSTWRNEVSARIALHIGRYRPARQAAKIHCPILFCVGDNDDLTAPGLVLEAARKAPRAEVKHYPIGHFDIYTGQWFDRGVADQAGFLTRHLLTGRATTPPAVQETS